MDFYESRTDGSRLQQGDILTDLRRVVTILDEDSINSDKPKILYVHHPIVIVLSQCCDLETDWGERTSLAKLSGQAAVQPIKGLLPNVIMTELKFVHQVKNKESKILKGSDWKSATQNKHERYQYLRRMDCFKEEGVEVDMVADFRNYFTVPTAELYFRLSLSSDALRIKTRLASPYNEHLLLRFHHFNQRIPLLEEHLPRERKPVITQVEEPATNN